MISFSSVCLHFSLNVLEKKFEFSLKFKTHLFCYPVKANSYDRRLHDDFFRVLKEVSGRKSYISKSRMHTVDYARLLSVKNKADVR